MAMFYGAHQATREDGMPTLLPNKKIIKYIVLHCLVPKLAKLSAQVVQSKSSARFGTHRNVVPSIAIVRLQLRSARECLWHVQK